MKRVEDGRVVLTAPAMSVSELLALIGYWVERAGKAAN